MDSFFQNLQTFLDENQIIIQNQFLDRVLKKFSYFHFSKNNLLSINSNIDEVTKIQLENEHQII